MRRGRTIDDDTRREAHRLAAESNLSRRAIAAQLGISRSSLYTILGQEPPPAAAPPRRGRPSKIESDAVVERYVEAIEEGMPPKDAAALAGVSPRTVETWEERAVEGDEPYASRWARISRALAEYRRRLREIVESGRPGWQGAWGLLKASDRATYGDHQVIETRQGADAESLSDEELRALALGAGA